MNHIESCKDAPWAIISENAIVWTRARRIPVKNVLPIRCCNHFKCNEKGTLTLSARDGQSWLGRNS